MDSNLYEPIVPAGTQTSIARKLWAPSGQTNTQYQPINTLPYFRYYSDQCKAIFYAFGGRVPIKTHKQLMQVTEDLLALKTRSAVKQNLALRTFGVTAPGQVTDDEVLEAFIHLAVRVLAMLDVGQFPNTHPSRQTLQWPSTDGQQTLAEFVAQTFPKGETLPYSGVRLGSHFTAQNLDLIADLKVELTTNLADHLLLQEDERTVFIFHHVSFLKNQQRGLFPPDLVDETISTIALLFPAKDKGTKRWYKKLDDLEDLDEMVMHCGVPTNRNIGDYHYWRDRLIILKEHFDEPQKRTWRQLWNDRREGIQWYTLWIAVACTVFFGLVQSVVGMLQLWKSW